MLHKLLRNSTKRKSVVIHKSLKSRTTPNESNEIPFKVNKVFDNFVSKVCFSALERNYRELIKEQISTPPKELLFEKELEVSFNESFKTKFLTNPRSLSSTELKELTISLINSKDTLTETVLNFAIKTKKNLQISPLFLEKYALSADGYEAILSRYQKILLVLILANNYSSDTTEVLKNFVELHETVSKANQVDKNYLFEFTMNFKYLVETGSSLVFSNELIASLLIIQLHLDK